MTPAVLASPAARALRALQKYDELQPMSDHRTLLMEAADALGELLGLDCTGTPEGGGHYGHDAGTCPIHEWLVPDDQLEVRDGC